MDFIGLVWKRVWKITFFGLKSGQDLKNRAHTHTKNFQEYPPPRICSQAWNFKLRVYLEHCFLQYTAVWAVWIDSVRIIKQDGGHQKPHEVITSLVQMLDAKTVDVAFEARHSRQHENDNKDYMLTCSV